MLARRVWILSYIGIVGIVLSLGWIVVQAQDGVALVFVTNTPDGPALSFATNTPADSLDITFATNTPRATPEPIVIAAIDRYGLRFWDETTLVNLLLDEVRQLVPGDSDRRFAVRLLQNELGQRFPGAPQDATQRMQLIEAMLAAPRGSVDLRPLVRAQVQAALNEQRPSFASMGEVTVGDFNIIIMPANLDGDGRMDAVLQTRFPAVVNNPAEIRYQDFVLARVDENGLYRVLDAAPSLPAAPLDDVTGVALERLSDLTGDGLAEMALAVERGDVNHELLIFGWRNGTVTNLIEPGQHINYGVIVDWPLGSTAFTVKELRLESPAWNCLGERDVGWSWNLNFFRPSARDDNFTFQNRLGCLLYGAEPLFALPPAAAINTIENVLPLALPEDAASVQRAQMVTAMLYVLEGRPDLALETARTLQTSASAGTWLADQTGAFLGAAEQAGVTPLKLCAALQAASRYGACDVDQVLTYRLTEQPLSQTEPISAQLARLGITVLDEVTISEISRADRQAVRFDLAGERWWAFSPLQDGVYRAEKIDPPTTLSAPAMRPSVITPPDTAYEALLLNGNPTLALNLLANSARDNPGVPLAASARFLQAVCYELLGSRDEARNSYYNLWREAPTSVWGELAAAHLEQR